jgi:hypothetical protein
MKSRLTQLALVGMLLVGQGYAQVVSVECCISDGNLTRIGACLSGPANAMIPHTCGSIGTCMLGFGPDTTLMDAMCDPDQAYPSDEPRAVCRSWVAAGTSVTHECVAKPNTDFNLFAMYDADHDSDLDLWDIAAFQMVYRSLPTLTPSDARLVSVECCISEANLTRIGECLSGPDNTRAPAACGSIGTCVLGFNVDTAVPDRMCDWTQPAIPHEPLAVCKSWVAPESSAAQRCVASPNTDFSPFEMFDADDDGDMDLQDVAGLQQIYQLLPKRIQGDARLVFVECCVGDTDSPPVCTLGFSAPVEPGDYLHELCQPGPVSEPGTGGSNCYSWTAGYVPVAYLCEARDVCEYRCPVGPDGNSSGGACAIDLVGSDDLPGRSSRQ